MKRLSIIAALLAMAAPAFAQDSTPPEAPAAAEKVEVSSIKDPELLPYRRMVRGLDAWEAKRALAPKADLRFELWTKDGKPADTEGLQLRIAGDAVGIALPLDGEGTFVLPRSQEAFDEKADLVSNRKKDQVRWRPRVRTPGVPASARRLGDLRLECEVGTAIRKEELPFLMRAGAAATGSMCKLPMTGYTYRAPQRLASATLVSGERRLTLPLVGKGEAYQLLLGDKGWDDEALVVYEFAEAKP